MRAETGAPPDGRLTALAIVLALAAEAAAMIVVYQVTIDFSCAGGANEGACTQLRLMLSRAISVAAAAAVYVFARRESAAALIAGADRNGWRGRWGAVQGAGFLLMMAPAVLLDPASGAFFETGLLFWLPGAAAAIVGALFWLASPVAWAAWLRREGAAPLAIAAAAAALPDLVRLIDPVWRLEAVTRATFGAVTWVLAQFDDTAVFDADRYLIRLGDFEVIVAASCSGVQGFALIIAFVLLYAWIFRSETRFPHFWIMLPVGVALSWTFNVVRIAVLIAIGAHVSPGLAVNGFHSHAGWVAFTALALAVMLLARTIPWLQAARAAPRRPARTPLLQDWAASRILPFVVFMLSSLLASTLVDPPGLAYPLRAAALAAALIAFAGLYRAVDWRVDPVALGAGLAVGVAWVATTPPPDGSDAALAAALAGLGPVAFALWALARVLGTVVLVPLTEELFFRDYLLRRLDIGGTAMRLVALGVSTAAFAALHGRWIEAAVAGLVFGLLFLRSGRVADAVVAHAAANAVVAAWALALGRWHAI